MKKIIVKNEEKGTRIDKYLGAKDIGISRVAIQRMLEEEKILVNNKKVKPSYKVEENDEVTIEAEEPKETKIKAQDIPIEIIYEDNDIIVVNKPKGMVVHPGNRKSRWNIGK